jgi:hypothetical protein
MEAVMNRWIRVSIGAVLALGIGAAVASAQQPKKLKESDLPEAVQKTATEQAGGAKVLAYWEREQDGGVIYEMDVDVEGHGKGVLIRPDGSVLAVQEEVSFDKLDAGVQSGIKQRAGEGKIDKVFSVTQDGKIVRYVAVVDKAGQKGKVVVGPTGEAPAEAKAPSP